jgi:hypothetical protein
VFNGLPQQIQGLSASLALIKELNAICASFSNSGFVFIASSFSRTAFLSWRSDFAARFWFSFSTKATAQKMEQACCIDLEGVNVSPQCLHFLGFMAHP